MILWYVPGASPGSRWHATQDKAKIFKQPFDKHTVAEDGREGMALLLNQCEMYAFGVGAGMREEIDAVAAIPDDDIDTGDIPEITNWSGAERGKFSTVPSSQTRLTAATIEDHILNHASVAEVERIFATLGTRFKELARGQEA